MAVFEQFVVPALSFPVPTGDTVLDSPTTLPF